jgi:hypothetical protein
LDFDPFRYVVNIRFAVCGQPFFLGFGRKTARIYERRFRHSRSPARGTGH